MPIQANVDNMLSRVLPPLHANTDANFRVIMRVPLTFASNSDLAGTRLAESSAAVS